MLSYNEDIPARAPKFDFELVSVALLNLIENERESATVVGIHGPWGSGKTTLINSLRHKLGSQPELASAIFVEFTAWKFQERESLWRALILRVLGELRSSASGESLKKLNELEASLYRALEVEEKGPLSVNWKALIVEIVKMLLSLVKLDFVAQAVRASTGIFARLFTWGGTEEGKHDDEMSPAITEERIEKISGILERETVTRHVEHVRSIEQFLSQFRQLVENLKSEGRRLFVFVDDLDRCLPESALEVFEAIKLFLDAPGCGYIVAVDREVIRKGLAVRYAPRGRADEDQSLIDPDEYIEKAISVSFDLPRLSDVDSKSLIEEYSLPITLGDDEMSMIVNALGTNPRRVKRFMNTLSVQLHLASLVAEKQLPVDECLLTGDGIKFQCFLKLLLVAYRFSGVFRASLDDAELLVRLQRANNEYQLGVGNSAVEARHNRAKALETELPLIRALDRKEEFWTLMKQPPDLNQQKNDVHELQNWFRYRPPTETADESGTV